MKGTHQNTSTEGYQKETQTGWCFSLGIQAQLAYVRPWKNTEEKH